NPASSVDRPVASDGASMVGTLRTSSQSQEGSRSLSVAIVAGAVVGYPSADAVNSAVAGATDRSCSSLHNVSTSSTIRMFNRRRRITCRIDAQAAEICDIVLAVYERHIRTSRQHYQKDQSRVYRTYAASSRFVTPCMTMHAPRLLVRIS